MAKVYFTIRRDRRSERRMYWTGDVGRLGSRKISPPARERRRKRRRLSDLRRSRQTLSRSITTFFPTQTSSPSFLLSLRTDSSPPSYFFPGNGPSSFSSVIKSSAENFDTWQSARFLQTLSKPCPDPVNPCLCPFLTILLLDESSDVVSVYPLTLLPSPRSRSKF